MKIHRNTICVAGLISMVTMIAFLCLNRKGDIRDLLIGVSASSFVALLSSIVGYFLERRKLYWLICNNSRHLFNTVNLMFVDYLVGTEMTCSKIKETIASREFNLQVRKWEDFYSFNFINTNSDFAPFCRSSKKHKIVTAVQEDIACYSKVVERLKMYYVDKKTHCFENGVDLSHALAIILEKDIWNLRDKTTRDLKALLGLLKFREVNGDAINPNP